MRRRMWRLGSFGRLRRRLRFLIVVAMSFFGCSQIIVNIFSSVHFLFPFLLFFFQFSCTSFLDFVVCLPEQSKYFDMSLFGGDV